MTFSANVEPLSPQAFLVLVRGEAPNSLDLGRRYLIPPSGLSLGNTLEADVYITDPQQQDCFVQIVQKNNSWRFRDLEIHSGALVNGIVAHQVHLIDGDIIQFKRTAFEFCSGKGIKVEFFEQNEKARIDDPLTHALNRRAWYQLVEQDLRRYKRWEEQRKDSPEKDSLPFMSVIMFDVDHFKKFNETYDHLVGDTVLRNVIVRIKERLRSTDLVGRYGGEEFLIYLPDTNLEQALEVADQVRLRISETPFDLSQNRHATVTISLGVAQFEGSMKDVDSFVKSANDFMRKAKQEGRNRVCG